MLENNYSKEDINNIYEALQLLKNENDRIYKSREFQLGSKIIKIKNCITEFKIKSIVGYLRAIKAKRKEIVSVNSGGGFINNFSCEDYFSDYRIAVYTSVYGNYDAIREPIICPNNIDYYILTDQNVSKYSKWNKIDIELPQGLTSAEKNRYVKMHPEKIFQNYEYSIYIDGSVSVISDLTPLTKQIGKYGIALHKHSKRKSVYEELMYAIDAYKISKAKAKEYEDYLRDNNFPDDYGLFECGVIARKHHNPLCTKIMDEWWHQYFTRIKRDQISLPFVLFENGIEVDEISTLGPNIYNNILFKIGEHI